MKKWIIGSLVGAIIVFLWQFLSWNKLHIHDGAMKYTPAQDQIMSTLSSSISEDGSYFIPNTKPDASMDEQKAAMNNMTGKPWAMITYGKSWSNDMTSSLIIGFLVDLILVVLVISILTRGGLPGFIGIFTGAIAIGVFSFLWGPYMMRNWFQVSWSSIQGYLIDAIVAWGLCGLWLAWWLRRPVNP